MDYKQIDKLLEKYFEGLTTLPEEKLLRDYFESGNIHPEHASYEPLFAHFRQTKTLKNPKTFSVPSERRDYKKLIAGIAATLILGLGVFSLQNKNNHRLVTASDTGGQISISNPDKEKESIQEIKKYTQELNKGLQQTGALSIFGTTTKKVFKLKNKKK